MAQSGIYEGYFRITLSRRDSAYGDFAMQNFDFGLRPTLRMTRRGWTVEDAGPYKPQQNSMNLEYPNFVSQNKKTEISAKLLENDILL